MRNPNITSRLIILLRPCEGGRIALTKDWSSSLRSNNIIIHEGRFGYLS